MTRRILLGACWVLAIGGCPTRTIYYDGGSDAMGGHGSGGHSGAAGDDGRAGAAGAGSGGQAGSAGRPGFAGAAGSWSGGAAGEALGGVAGQAFGGAAGAASGGHGAGGAAGRTSDPSGQAGGPAGAGGGHAGGSAGSSPPPKAKDGERCALAGDCASGACTAFYVDLDGDGYGAGQAVGFCGVSAPVGYAAQPGDCCDTATNLAVAKLIHPGADFQTTSAGGICNITWDYDCSGAVESNPQDCVSCSSYPTCECITGNRPDTSCGTSGINSATCVSLPQTQSCNHFPAGGGPGTIGCK